jgi:hypothetical protein
LLTGAIGLLKDNNDVWGCVFLAWAFALHVATARRRRTAIMALANSVKMPPSAHDGGDRVGLEVRARAYVEHDRGIRDRDGN